LRCTAQGAPLEMPLRALELPPRFFGTGYFLVELLVKNATALTLLLDTGLTAPIMLTSAACTRLGISEVPAGPGTRGIGAIGTMDLRPVQLDGAELRTPAGALPLGPMTGVVVDDFLQRKIGQEVGVALDGMLGQGFLQRCDLEFDGHAAALRVWPPGRLAGAAEDGRWRLLPSLRLPGDLQGLLLSVPGGLEPVVGVVDSGASHTVVNHNAAYVLGLEVPSAQSGEEGRTVRGIGLDSSALEMPLLSVDGISLCGANHVTIVPRDPGAPGTPRSWSFRNVTCLRDQSVGPLGPAEVAVGDIGFFEELFSQPQDSIGDFRGPVALLGQDLLAQLPLRISSSAERIWLRQS